MKPICSACGSENVTYRWSQPSLKGGQEYDIYKCEDCETFLEIVPEYEILEDAIASDRPEESLLSEGMNW